MADHTAIEWCDATLNLWWGCTKVSEGCKHCYADAWSKRHGRAVWGPNGTRVEVKSWRSTLKKISKRAKAENRRLRVFVQSMSDTFEGPETMGGEKSANWAIVQQLQDEILSAVFDYPDIDFLFLTKRPENILSVCHKHDEPNGFGGYIGWSFPPNFWIGTSVEDQKTADERIPHLLKVPAAVRFLSCEPLLGPVDLKPRFWLNSGCCGAPSGIECPDTVCPYKTGKPCNAVDWVICGGESGPKARPMHPNWARSLRDQCQAAGIPFFFKQWGEWAPDRNAIGDLVRTVSGQWQGEQSSTRVGKKKAGRILDGRTWDEFPEVARG